MEQDVIRLGVIGLSEGNGHPYSWSAICNGYDAIAMADCGFPVITDYLAKQRWPDDRLPDVVVTHVWTQDEDLSRRIARAALIEKVAERPEDMIGAVDGVLLARDDAENHTRLARPFLTAGLPVYIDKPAALSVDDFEHLLALQKRPGLIFTATALRYAKELQLDDESRAEIGSIRHVFGMTPKSWDRYGIHVIEPALALLDDPGEVAKGQTWAQGEARGLDVCFASGAQAHFVALGNVAAPIALRVVGSDGWRDLVFRDSFSCFRTALAEFLAGIRAGRSRSDPGFTRRVIDLLQRGRS
jgi:predicted dehydrogenase